MEKLLAPFTAAALELQTDDRGDLERLQRQHEKITRQIEFTLDNLGESESDTRESQHRLKKLRGERSSVAAELAERKERRDRPKTRPTAETFQTLLTEMEQVLLNAASSQDPADAGALRALLELLTDGKIEVEQAGERRRRGGWLRLKVKLRLLQACWSRLKVNDSNPSESTEIVIDLRPETLAPQHVTAVMQLHQDGLTFDEIAKELNLTERQAYEIARAEYVKKGIPFEYPQKFVRKDSVYKQMAEEAKKLCDDEENFLLREIAVKLKCSRATVREAFRYWYQVRGEPMPNLRLRQKSSKLKPSTNRKPEPES